MNFDRKFKMKKVIIHFLETKRRERENIKALHACINSGFKLLVILPFIVADNLKGELLLRTTKVVLTKVCSFS